MLYFILSVFCHSAGSIFPLHVRQFIHCQPLHLFMSLLSVRLTSKFKILFLCRLLPTNRPSSCQQDIPLCLNSAGFIYFFFAVSISACLLVPTLVIIRDFIWHPIFIIFVHIHILGTSIFFCLLLLISRFLHRICTPNCFKLFSAVCLFVNKIINLVPHNRLSAKTI